VGGKIALYGKSHVENQRRREDEACSQKCGRDEDCGIQEAKQRKESTERTVGPWSSKSKKNERAGGDHPHLSSVLMEVLE